MHQYNNHVAFLVLWKSAQQSLSLFVCLVRDSIPFINTGNLLYLLLVRTDSLNLEQALHKSFDEHPLAGETYPTINLYQTKLGLSQDVVIPIDDQLIDTSAHLTITFLLTHIDSQLNVLDLVGAWNPSRNLLFI